MRSTTLAMLIGCAAGVGALALFHFVYAIPLQQALALAVLILGVPFSIIARRARKYSNAVHLELARRGLRGGRSSALVESLASSNPGVVPADLLAQYIRYQVIMSGLGGFFIVWLIAVMTFGLVVVKNAS
jgi:hypothetical protein